MSYRKIKIGVIVAAPYIYKTKLKNGKHHFRGFLFDIWQLIARKNNLICVYTELKGSNYAKILRENTDKVDVIIGDISNSAYRYRFVNFTNPIKLNRIVLARKKTFKPLVFLLKFIKSITIPLTVLIIVGVVLGICLDLVNKGRRTSPEDLHGESILRPILSAVASMFGEMGFVSERAGLSIASIVTVILIMVISYFSSIYFQAMTIGDMISFDNASVVQQKGVDNLKLLTVKGTAVARIVESSGAKVEYIANKSREELIKHYKENLNKYDGFVLDSEVLGEIVKNDPAIMIDPHVFGYDDIQFAVSKRNFQLLSKINKSILELQSSLKIKEICSKYKGIDEANCII